MNRWLLLILIVLSLVSCTEPQQVGMITEDVVYFEETGHTVRGEFSRFFHHYGGEMSLGYPLTEEIIVDGWTVQYFQKGRLEHHPENEPAYRVTVGWLGDLLHRRQPPIPAADIPPGTDTHRRYFATTGHTVSGDFLSYFEAHGGNDRFGQPISEPFLWQGYVAQDFQSARFLWTPHEKVTVTLEEIGRVHFETLELDQELLKPLDNKSEGFVVR
jgi:hypothetical protein